MGPAEKSLNGDGAFRTTLTRLTRLAQRRPGQVELLRSALTGRSALLWRAAFEVALELGDPIGRLLAERIESELSLPQVEALLDRCDAAEISQSLPLLELAVAATKICIAATSSTQGRAIRLWHNLGVRLQALGRPNEALEATRRVVDMLRPLAVTNVTALADLARSLNSLGHRYLALGAVEASVEALNEAVEIDRRRARDATPDQMRDLASTLNNLAFVRHEAGQLLEALAAAREAVEIRRHLANQQRERFESELAQSLVNLGLVAEAPELRAEALQATREAVAIFRCLAAEQEDRFLPHLGMALHNLASLERDAGNFPVALSLASQATELRVRTHEQRPRAFTADLARSFDLLGSLLRDLGRGEEGLIATSEAVALLRTVASENPSYFGHRLARMLVNQAIVYSDLGRLTEADGAVREALGALASCEAERPRSRALVEEALSLQAELAEQLREAE